MKQRRKGVSGGDREKEKKEKKRKEEKKRKKKKKEEGKGALVALPTEGKSVDLLPLYAKTSIFRREKGKYPSLPSLLMKLGYTKGGCSLEGSDKGCRGS